MKKRYFHKYIKCFLGYMFLLFVPQDWRFIKCVFPKPTMFCLDLVWLIRTDKKWVIIIRILKEKKRD